jgi:hypothetical protein
VNQAEIQHRDQVLRTYFRGRGWDRNNEFLLKRQLILHSSKLLPRYPYVIDDEWEVEASYTDKGRGDLIFTDGAGYYAVVEVKWIDVEGTGRQGTTKRGSNRQKRRKVEQQAIHYATCLLERLDDVVSVSAYIFTNECDYPISLTNLKPGFSN